MNYIKLITPIPNPQDEIDYQLFSKFEARSMHGQLPIIWDKAKDFNVYDKHGNKFLDFTSGICVTNVGHGNEQIRNILKTLIDRPLLHSYTFATDIRFWFLRELVETCYPNGKAFLVSAGTEATEVACKLMRMYGQQKDSNRRVILSIKDCMHGRTMLTEQLRGISENNLWAFSFDTSIKHITFPFKPEDYNPKEICGIIIESYQGWSAGFYNPIDIQLIVKWAKENDILVCFDEVQGGFGRTGKMWAYEHYFTLGSFFQPDLICFGKGVSSSLPLSGVLGRADILDLPPIGSMSSTHSANPLSCGAGLKTLLELKNRDLIKETERKGEIVIRELFTYLFPKNRVTKIQGKGLLWAIITDTEETADKIVWECFKRGLLTIWTHKPSVKLAPPLTINDEALIYGINILKEVVQKL
jgi:4-aminobutyrate aminotransferase-like enzyme